MDIAAALVTADYRRTHIAGKQEHAKDLTGTGSCFDATRLSAVRAGGHVLAEVTGSALPRWNGPSLTHRYSSPKPSPKRFLHSGDGGGAMQHSAPPPSRLAAPPKAGAFARRANPPNTAFRRAYERGELPLCIEHKGFKNTIKWKVDLTTLDLHHYLPLFLDGVRETLEPCRFLAVRGTQDLLAAAGGRALPVLPQLILPIKTALNTRDPAVICVTLHLLQKLVMCSESMGQALVPYYRQLLPVLNLFKTSNRNTGDAIDYGQQRHDCLGDLICETLELLEARGGRDAFVNIKYLVPTYESCVSAA